MTSKEYDISTTQQALEKIQQYSQYIYDIEKSQNIAYTYQKIWDIDKEVRTKCSNELFEWCGDDAGTDYGFHNVFDSFTRLKFAPKLRSCTDECDRFVKKLISDKPDFVFYEPVKSERDISSKRSDAEIRETIKLLADAFEEIEKFKIYIKNALSKSGTNGKNNIDIKPAEEFFDRELRSKKYHDAAIQSYECLYQMVIEERNRTFYNIYYFVFLERKSVIMVDGFHNWKSIVTVNSHNILLPEYESELETDEDDFDEDDSVVIPEEVKKRIGVLAANLPGFSLLTNQQMRSSFISDNWDKLDLSKIQNIDKMDFTDWVIDSIAIYAKTHFETVVLPEKVKILQDEGKTQKEIAQTIGISINKVRKIQASQ